MPRKGKGSKTQAVRTAKGQAYGSAQSQREAQEVRERDQTPHQGVEWAFRGESRLSFRRKAFGYYPKPSQAIKKQVI